MSEASAIKIPVWFWVVTLVCLVWNLLGVMAFISQMMLSADDLAAMAEAERNLYETTPGWATGAFALAVFAGAIGCIGLLLRKNWALWVLVLSLLGVLVQMSYSFLISDFFDVYGADAAIMPVVVIIIALFLVWFSRMAAGRGWLN